MTINIIAEIADNGVIKSNCKVAMSVKLDHMT